MEPSQPPALLGVIVAVAFPVFFVGIWSFVCFLIASASGWRAMARTYACPEGLRGERLPSGWINRVGAARYKGVLSFEAAPQGLIARVGRLFVFHPPLLLPWSALRLSRVGGLFHAGDMQVVGGSTFRVNEDAMASLERALASAQPRSGWAEGR